MKQHAVVASIALIMSALPLHPGCGQAQRAGSAIVVGETIVVPSRHLEREMIIDVYLPDGYGSSAGRYPVLFTCQSTFLHVSGIAADLARKNKAPELIVASVRNYSSDDFIPERIEGHPKAGGADRFIAFFKDELIPDIDSRYRTRPFRVFYSGSFGGGFCVYALLTRPDAFNACIASTPSIDYEGGSTLIMSNVGSYLAARRYAHRFLYLGVENDSALISVLDRFVAVLDSADTGGLKWEYVPSLDEDHGSIVNKVIYHGLEFVFSDWSAIPAEVAGNGVAAIRAYAAGLGEEYGYDIGVSTSALRKAAQALRKQGRASEAVETLRFALEREPESEMTWLDLGRTYESNNQLEEAKRALETAHRRAVEHSSPHLAIFVEALDSINRKRPNR